MSASGVAPGAMPIASMSGWKPDAVVSQPSTAHIAMRPCLSSDSRRYGTLDASLVKPRGSKNPMGALTPTISDGAIIDTAERGARASSGAPPV
jgi:hypothetical protein